MNDYSSDLENYDELKFSRERGFFEKSIVIRILLGLIFTFSLFLFLHFREIRVDLLELNSTASNYIVAQVDFNFLDEAATSILKEEAVRDVGKIFQLSDKQIRQRRMEFENFLIYNQAWRKNIQDITFEKMYQEADILEKILLQLKFTDARTLQKIKDLNLSTSYYLIYIPTELSGVRLPSQIWKFLNLIAFPKGTADATTEFTINFFKSFNWTIEEDISSERILRKRIQAEIPNKYTHVSAGSRILDQGEKVSARHIAMVLAMKDALNANRNLWYPLTLIGSFILATLLTAICVIYLHSNHSQILSSNRKLSLIITIIILTLVVAKVTELFLLNSTSNAFEQIRYPVFVAFPAILLCSLINPGIATFASGFLAFILMITLSFERQGFLIINLAAALVAVLSTRSLRRRKEIFVVCAKAWLCCIAFIFALGLSQNILWNPSMLADIVNAAICLLLTAIAVVGLLPLLESTFRIMTDASLTEYMDPNNDLLRRLTIEAPGTYQHSVVVGNIAEAAAVAIGANGLFCRVATLYHDIGKMITPQYFTENQQDGIDVHQLLTPQESAAVIIAHVSEGVAIARKADLPEQFIDIIKEHHGTTLVYYFYRKQLEKMDGDKNKVNEAEFRYAGPKPHSKESAIIMIADTLEAASRSLDKIDEPTLMELALRLVREKADDGQFDHCLLTLEELAIVTASLVKTLVAFGHTRLKYPTREPRHASRSTFHPNPNSDA